MSEPIPANENALCIAAIFEDFAIDHAPDGWPAVKQQHLNAAAQEIRRMNALCVQLYEAVDMLRRQHEAIVKLREALENLVYQGPWSAEDSAKQLLKDTEEIAK